MQSGSFPSGDRTTRRRFLRRASAGAAALAMGIPLVLPGSALGFGRPAPSRRVTVGFIGVGWKGLPGCYGALVLDFLRNPICQALAVCDVNGSFRAAAKATVDKLQGDNSCQAYVDFPRARGTAGDRGGGHRHAASLARGADHPCLPARQGRLLRKAVVVDGARSAGDGRCGPTATGRIVQTGSQSRSYQTIRRGVDLIRSGRIGRVKRINAGCGGPPVPCGLPAEPLPADIDWDLWPWPRPLAALP